MGRKIVVGILPALMAGVLGACASTASDDQTAKVEKAKNYDEMVVIPAGKFIFGKVEAKQTVTLPVYAIDKYEVTNEQYAKVNPGYKYEPEWAHFPVAQVSQIDAVAYCQAVGKRLPTEQEWEKAARGDDGRLYPWGNEFDETAAVTNETATQGIPMDVGSREKGQSPYGVMDMAGNVWEWTSSYDTRYIILRGGSFFEGGSYAKVISTIGSIPQDAKDYIGFRCVKGN
jgi:iron(II)-dependent oxidoreductase